MELTNTQKQDLYEAGLVRLPGIVPQPLVEGALQAINASLGERGLDPASLPLFRARSYCPELTATAPITDLYNRSPLAGLAESLIGPGNIRPITSGQIALRFPAIAPPKRLTPHIDGMSSPNNGVPAGTIASFTALVGVFLSDIPHPDMGNFTVFPGSHHVLERYFQENGPQSLLDGFPPVDIGPGQQITARPGDAVICHYQLAHSIAGNASPFIRYGIFFRLSHTGHEGTRWECLTDIWREWEGMEPVVQERRGGQ